MIGGLELAKDNYSDLVQGGKKNEKPEPNKDGKADMDKGVQAS